MSITTEIERIENAKASIKTAIENKGVTVGDGTIDTYASKIDEISGGGSSEIEITDASYLFYYGARLNNLEEILKLCKNVTNCSYMFNYCSNLTSLDLSNFDTSNVTNMSTMFNNCSNITELDLSNFDTSKVTTFQNMFNGCSKLTKLNISNFNTEKNTTMEYMFSSNKITELDLSNFKTNNLKSLHNTFNGCKDLINLNISFDGSTVTTVYQLFYNCLNLENLLFSQNIGKGYTQKSNNYSNYTVDLHWSKNLTHESLMDVINKLYDLNLTYDVANGGTLYTQKLILGADNLAKLTEDEIAIVTAKGWVVS